MYKKLAGLLAVLTAGLFWVGSASAQITGSAHDLQAELTITEICVVCHAPHDNQNANGDLLWNHDPSTNVGSFTVYDSPTLDSAAGQPSSTSILCLGCHDGTAAVDSYGGVTGTLLVNNAAFGGDESLFGSELGNDHPVGLTYDPVADTELNAIATAVTFADASTGTIDDMLEGTSVECSSCHDVHDTVSNGGDRLLVVDNAASGLCTTCHAK